MFDNLYKSIDGDTPYYHYVFSPEQLATKEKSYFIGRAVDSTGATWYEFNQDGEINKETQKCTAPWIEPRFTVSVTLWDSIAKIYTFVLAENEPQSNKWKIWQSYTVSGGQKVSNDGTKALIELIWPAIKWNNNDEIQIL